MRKVSKKQNSRAFITGASISCVILLAIIGSIIYKTELADVPSEEPTVEVPVQETVPPINEEQPEAPKEQQDEASVVEEPAEKVVETEPQVNAEKPEVEKPVTSSGYIDGQQPPTEPTYIDEVLIANKKYPLPASYNEGEDPTARAAFEKMAATAKEQGIELVAFSGFRSYDYQTTLYTNYVKRDGKEQADRYSARPGHSEHQTGLAFDIGEKGREDLWLTSAFGETKAGQWLVNHAHEYGFILRYPKGKEDITGFMYESWHFRYLGVELATKVYAKGVTLEEYLNIQ